MRWISADSVTPRVYDPPSLNKYTFVRNDPVNLVDPDGRNWQGIADEHRRLVDDFWEYWYTFDFWWIDEGSSGGENPGGGPSGSYPSIIGPYDTKRFDECRQIALSQGANPKQLPNGGALNWLLWAYAEFNVDPAILGSIWSKESEFSMEMVQGFNRDENGNILSIDWGPLQINSHWKLDDPDWQKQYNSSAADLTVDVWASFVAGAHDLADHGAGGSKPDLAKSIIYWHGLNEDSVPYGIDVAARYQGIATIFNCMKDHK
jgi:hypothetical protein